jgi:hypothetical protein
VIGSLLSPPRYGCSTTTHAHDSYGHGRAALALREIGQERRLRRFNCRLVAAAGVVDTLSDAIPIACRPASVTTSALRRPSSPLRQAAALRAARISAGRPS